jgi:hypothetical protein
MISLKSTVSATSGVMNLFLLCLNIFERFNGISGRQYRAANVFLKSVLIVATESGSTALEEIEEVVFLFWIVAVELGSIVLEEVKEEALFFIFNVTYTYGWQRKKLVFLIPQ